MPEAGRVITGTAGGLRLDAPGPGTRPISDRVKQALFSIMEAERPDAWDHAVLDLFAGSGALAIEALSRGAPLALLVEHDRRAVTVIGRNLARTGLAARGRILRADVLDFLAAPPSDVAETPFGAVFVDPPYERSSDLASSLASLAGPSDWLHATALVAAKHFWKRSPPDDIGELHLIRSRRFGETALSVYRRHAETVVGGT